MNRETIFDPDSALERVEGDREFLAELYQDIVTLSSEQIQELEQRIEKSEIQYVRETAHSMKSALRNLGGWRAGATAEELEHCAARGDRELADALLEKLKTEVDLFKDEFRKQLEVWRTT